MSPAWRQGRHAPAKDANLRSLDCQENSFLAATTIPTASRDDGFCRAERSTILTSVIPLCQGRRPGRRRTFCVPPFLVVTGHRRRCGCHAALIYRCALPVAAVDRLSVSARRSWVGRPPDSEKSTGARCRHQSRSDDRRWRSNGTFSDRGLQQACDLSVMRLAATATRASTPRESPRTRQAVPQSSTAA